MDYKYIEQLLERYFACETSVEEERILKAFFTQEEIPANLAPYKVLFDYQRKAAGVELKADFDEHICKKVNTPILPTTRRERIVYRLRPLYRAVASVAIVVLLVGALQHAFGPDLSAPPVESQHHHFINGTTPTASADSICHDTINY